MSWSMNIRSTRSEVAAAIDSDAAEESPPAHGNPRQEAQVAAAKLAAKALAETLPDGRDVGVNIAGHAVSEGQTGTESVSASVFQVV